MIKTIVFMGDSHTWGEGVGAEYGFNPHVICADKRMNSFIYPSYVNLIREWVNARTESSAKEIIGDKLFNLCGGNDRDFGILSAEIPMKISEKFALCRVFFVAPKKAVNVTVTLDGKNIGKLNLQSDAENTSGNIVPFSFFPECDETHEIKISADGDGAAIHRIEIYSGEYAIINSGVGSCPVGNYLNTFFDNYVSVFKPHAVVFEGNTINDWLSGETLGEYANQLTKATERLNELTDKVLNHSVCPIAGVQRDGQSTADYDEFARVQKDTLRSLGANFCDSRAEFERELSNVPEESRERFIYHDRWHPNGTGHYIYARTIIPELAELLGI